MKVSILASNLSSNAMGRVLVLARALERRYEVEVVGPMFGDGIWSPIESENLDIKSLKISESPRSIPQLRELARMPTGDILYASKPVWTSFGAALSARKQTGRPLVLDIDDWEWGFSQHAIRTAKNKLRYIASAAVHAHLPNAWPSAFYFDRITARADAVTTSNSFLQKRFDGSIVWHGRDTDAFSPERFPGDSARQSLGFSPQDRIVMFFGTMQRYKGVEDLIRAVAQLNRPDVRLVLVGAGELPGAREATAAAQEALGDRVTVFGMQPFERVPEFISAADVVVVPQRRTQATQWQMPAKIFDAMAMARPVVATAVSDIPAVLEGCGWVVDPDSPDALARAIAEVLDDPVRAEAAGASARRRCVERYSWDAMEHTLNGVFAPLEEAA